MSDRTIHARCEGMEIVRYDRAGKWYLEPIGLARHDPHRRGKRVTIQGAVNAAIANRAEWFPGRPGGLAFDRRIRDAAF